MKIEEAKSLVIKVLKENEKITAQKLNYSLNNSIPLVQIYGIMAQLVKAGAVKVFETDGGKFYSLVDESKLTGESVTSEKTNAPEVKVEDKKSETQEPDEKHTIVKTNKGGRDLTKYKFLGVEYNKGRLAHAIISNYCKDKRPSLKSLLEVFPDKLVPPYGTIKPVNVAKDLSKERQRFFIKPEEEVKMKDGSIAVSNQWTSDRIEKLIAIAKGLGYKIE